MSTPQFPAPDGDGPVGPPPVPAMPVPAMPAPPAAPPGAYQVPVGGYQASVGGYPGGGYQVPPARPQGTRTTGAVALVLALLAAIVVPIVGGLIAYQIGALLPGVAISVDSSFSDDLAVLSPARTQVLWAEITFWTGTALGIGAIVLGIVAAAKRRGRGLGITAIVLSVLGPVGFFLVVSIFLGIGAFASASSGL
ncbi:hypothetical protein [Microbacterium suwonense]|uniref:DUF4064 domain-containing protein n=1 Tax=Microbacterium suwonense TaxID=683047 RepID=A0ABM8FQV7_9MICO|nr:hypothetical protein [Microbacterium suwonense]BDZ37709.1 hypothetical protein GCM10025863_03230 [Microbacterium suwonense]